MTKDSTGDGIKAANASWSFSGSVADSFDKHVSRSVPLYEKGHSLVCKLSDYFVNNDSICYELGCSTGELINKLANHNADKSNARFIGIEIEEAMLVQAKKKEMQKNVELIQDDILQYHFESSDLIVAYCTIQFIRSSERQRLIDKLYSSLNWGGALLMYEKVRGPDARFQDIMTGIYTEEKIDAGYSAEEIQSKSRSLKGVLEPFSTKGNYQLLQRAGFEDVLTIMKYVCFEMILAIK